MSRLLALALRSRKRSQTGGDDVAVHTAGQFVQIQIAVQTLNQQPTHALAAGRGSQLARYLRRGRNNNDSQRLA